MPSAEAVSFLKAHQYELAYTTALECLTSNIDDAECWNIKGVVEAHQRDWPAAQTSLRRAVDLRPSEGHWWRNLGVALLAGNRYSDAAECLNRSLDLLPDRGTKLYLAETLAYSGKKADALRLIAQLRQHAPTRAPDEFKIGRIYEQLAHWQEAVDAYEASLRLDPSDARCRERLVDLYRRLHRQQRAQHHVWKLCMLEGFQGARLHDLALANFDLGRLERAKLQCRRLLEQTPANAKAHSDLLFYSLHRKSHDAELRSAHEEWFRLHGGTAIEHRFTNRRDPNRRLRIGFPSGGLIIGPTDLTLVPILRNHDRCRFELFFYRLNSHQDSATEEYRKIADHWRDLNGLHNGEIREAILKDEIDIAIDISGHLAPQALPLFQARVAPVQAALPIYPCTTGCRNTDYILTDERITPNAESKRQYTERAAYRVASGYIAFEPPAGSPDVSPLPAQERGYITFGLFQRTAKYHSEFWDAVAAVLSQCTGSKLLIQFATADFDDPRSFLRRLHVRELAARGIPEDRIEFRGVADPSKHLELVSAVDIALDTWPYNGHTTTLCCYWMGVPVVSLAGKTHASRVTLALSHHVGLSDWVVETPHEYVDLAVRKASDLKTLGALRSSLRERMANSALCRPELVARGLEAAYREMWISWCNRTD